jgi:chromosome segregation ATPase
MRNVRPIIKKDLIHYSKDELIRLLTSIEEQYNSKSKNLRDVHSKLTRARIRIQAQKQRLQHLRKRVVELTPNNHEAGRLLIKVPLDQIKG